MMKKRVVSIFAVSAAVLAMSVNVMAAGSVTGGNVDTNNVTVSGTTTAADTTQGLVGDKASVEVSGEATLTKNVEGLYEEEVQTVVDALNEVGAETTVLDAFKSVFADADMPEISHFKLDGSTEENVDLSEYKFLSPVMDLKIEGAEPTEENPVKVTFTVNNLTDNIEVSVLHYCEEHGWEMMETEVVGDNQISAEFHSAGGPVALIYKEKPAEETDTEVVAP